MQIECECQINKSSASCLIFPQRPTYVIFQIYITYMYVYMTHSAVQGGWRIHQHDAPGQCTIMHTRAPVAGCTRLAAAPNAVSGWSAAGRGPPTGM